MIVTDENILSQGSFLVHNDEDVSKLMEDMEAEISKHPNAIGLSAIQIGVPKRVICFRQMAMQNGSVGIETTFMINPSFTNHSNDGVIAFEGCLSYPDKFIETKRHSWIEIKYGTKDREWVSKVFKGTLARAIQHELDHLDGISMFQREYKRKTANRNEPCPICKSEGISIKYKKCKKHFCS